MEVNIVCYPWELCLERNNRVFGNKSKSMEVIVGSIVWSVSKWVSKGNEFEQTLCIEISE